VHQTDFFRLDKDTVRPVPINFTGIPAFNQEVRRRVKKQTYINRGLAHTNAGAACAAGKGNSVRLLY
jgi:hypothetical protein